MFLNPIMLAGLGGAVIPLVLHLLSRSRYRTVDWGAMMFLDGVDARVMQAARVRQGVILLLRMAIVAGLAMALAQPVIRGRWGGLAREGRATAVIVLDCSASMGYDESGKSRMDLARSAVLGVLESLRGSRVAVVVMGGGRASAVDELAVPTTDLQQLAQRVMSIGDPVGRANLTDGLTRAADILDRTAEPTRELYVVCDRQASSWREASADGFKQSWRARLNRAAGTRTRFFVIPIGSEKSDNLAIESVELINGPAVRDQPAEIEVRVRNYGPTYRSGVEVRVEGQTTTLAVGPDAAATVRVPIRVPTAGTRLIEATLTGAGLKFDDRMQAAVEVMEPVNVLVVSGDERGAGGAALTSEADFLRIALAPRAAEARLRGQKVEGAVRGDPCAVSVEPYETWNEEAIRKYQVVVLANVPQLSQGQAVALEQFVYEGGGLWIAPGNLTRVDNFNWMLYRDGTGILPARLLPPTAEDGSEATTIQGISDFDHPVMRFLKGRPDPIPAVAIGRYFPVEVRTRDAKVLSQYASGRPFLVEGAVGRAHVLLMTVPLDADWGTLPLTSFYLPLAQSAVRHLASGLSAERNLKPGEPLIARFGPGIDARRVEIRSPTGSDGIPVKPVTLPVTGGEVRFTATHQPGVYDVRVTDGTVPDWARRALYVVRTEARESDVTPLAPSQWKDLAAALEFELADPAERPVATVVAASRRGRELWLTLVGLVVVLSLLEMALVRRWAGGAS